MKSHHIDEAINKTYIGCHVKITRPTVFIRCRFVDCHFEALAQIWVFNSEIENSFFEGPGLLR